MEELYKFMNQSNATLDLKVGNELATEEGEPAEVLAVTQHVAGKYVRIACIPTVP